MRSGYILITIGFFFSSFYLNIGGVRILPPFLGLLVMVLGLSRVRNYYSSSASRAAGIFYRLGATVSAVGSVLSLSRYVESSPLGFALPALPVFFAAANLCAALGMLFLLRQAAEYFPKYSTHGLFWQGAGIVLPILYCFSETALAVLNFLPAGSLSSLVFYYGLCVKLLLSAVLIAAAASDHTAVRRER